MDTTEQYIKMCEKAVPDIHCTNFNTLVGDRWGIHLVSGDIFYFNSKGHATWLPRQDQLQEMLEFPMGMFNDNFWSALGDLHEYAFTPNIFNEWIPLTMEQLWLAFVMKEKYGKVWDGENWAIDK